MCPHTAQKAGAASVRNVSVLIDMCIVLVVLEAFRIDPFGAMRKGLS
jgi:hypothetical protein